jgi:hypothetical protein
MWNEFWRVPPPAALPDGPKKIREIERLDSLLQAKSPSVARFILAETKDQAEKKRASHRTLETKATSVIGFSAVVLGFAAGFNQSELLKIIWHGVPAILPTLLLEAAAIIAGLMALRAQDYRLPDAVNYNYPDALEDPLNEARIAMALTQSWAHYERCLDAGNATRSRRFSVALWAFVLGLFWTVGLAAGDVFVNSTVTHQAGGASASSAQRANPYDPAKRTGRDRNTKTVPAKLSRPGGSL